MENKKTTKARKAQGINNERQQERPNDAQKTKIQDDNKNAFCALMVSI